MQSSYVFSATVFFAAFIAVVAVYGGDTARYLVAISAFIGALSQFVAQDDRPTVGKISIVLAYVAMGFGVAALVMWK